MPRRPGSGRGRGGPPYYPPPPFGNTFGPPTSPGLGGDDQDEEEIDPKAYYACVDQVWDQYAMGNWLTRKLKPPSPPITDGRLIFKAFNRVYGAFGPSTDDHTWIDFKSQALIDFLRSEASLKGLSGLLHPKPGIDARELFLRLPRLKELAVEPTAKDEPLPALVPTEPELPQPAPTSKLGPDNVLAPAPQLESTQALSAAQPSGKEAEGGMGSSEAMLPPPIAPNDPPTPIEPPLSAPEQLYILVKFIEEHFRDTVEELERLKEDGYMPFKFLWTLCAPGSVVEVEDQATGYPVGVRVESWSYGNNGGSFKMRGVKYVWNGKVFKQNQVSCCIHTPVPTQGLMQVGQLPIKVLSDHARKRLIDRGKLYEKFAGVHHLRYDAFICISTQCGHIRRPAKGRVMIDTAGFYRFNLNASGGPDGRGPDYPSPTGYGLANIMEYQSTEPLPDDILCLTPPAHLGWSFTAKRWGLLLVESLAEIQFDEMAFDQLVLKKEYKKMIKALVETHAGHGDGLAKDLVAGKGGGMVMVLHGKPGTGKTLTAEAVSEHLKCPLYVASSGELGIQAAQLEKQLNDILEMTASWGAVVLIDEADVFLEARNTNDLVRNSLVSVFLRLLEYHTGVLILTTNRIRSFDKAFVSRFTIALHYPDLDQGSRLLIWKEFLGRAGIEVGVPEDPAPSRPLYLAHSDILTLAKKSFNGRVIKQLVRGAQALAIAEKEPLELSHIITVLEITEQFETDWKELEFTDDIKGAGGNEGAS
ncbi:hypothetical protein FRC06_001200 [Ceratobasidium sp. 370]|nr:hypothetical protein FRC06_001200 [Ceratobasidium sp. 370]